MSVCVSVDAMQLIAEPTWSRDTVVCLYQNPRSTANAIQVRPHQANTDTNMDNYGLIMPVAAREEVRRTVRQGAGGQNRLRQNWSEAIFRPVRSFQSRARTSDSSVELHLDPYPHHLRS